MTEKSELPETFVPEFHDEHLVRKMKYNKFGKTGLRVSEISLGTGGFCSNYGNYSLEECKEIVSKALRSGINYIDTAPWYGHGVSETILGKCLENVPRKAYYIATKVGRYERDPKLMFDFSAKKTKESIETSLNRLGVDYIDILQVHDIEFAPSLDVVFNETLPVIAGAVRMGKVKFIGVTGYPVSELAEFIVKSNINIDSVLTYTRLSLLDETLKKYLPLFQDYNVGIVNASVNCMGLLCNAGPPVWHPAPKSVKDVCSQAADYCKSLGIELGKLAVHYALQQPGPHTCLIGLNRKELVESTFDVYHNGLTEEEQAALKHVQSLLKSLEVTDWEGVEVAQFRSNKFEFST